MAHDAETSPEDGKPMDGDPSTRTRVLFHRWRAGESEAFVSLFKLHQPWLAELIEHSLGAQLRRKVDPEDVAQEVGIRLLSYKPKAEDGALERLRALLRTMMKHVIADQHRHHFGAEMRDAGADVPLPTDSNVGFDGVRDANPSPGGAAERRHDVALARVTFWFVASDKRDLIALRWWYHVPFGELATRFGCEEASLRMRHLRATQEFAGLMARVRTALAKLAPEEFELLEAQTRPALGTDSGIDSRVLAHSRIERFAAFLDALRQVSRLIGEPLNTLPDSWPRCLLTEPPDLPKPPNPPKV
ncbi:MAG: hypothetical protein EXS13_12215 [Planctomycetes bacterium]|nr:hypothetical protein [Planctomycetota bacterium]